MATAEPVAPEVPTYGAVPHGRDDGDDVDSVHLRLPEDGATEDSGPGDEFGVGLRGRDAFEFGQRGLVLAALVKRAGELIGGAPGELGRQLQAREDLLRPRVVTELDERQADVLEQHAEQAAAVRAVGHGLHGLGERLAQAFDRLVEQADLDEAAGLEAFCLDARLALLLENDKPEIKKLMFP